MMQDTPSGTQGFLNTMKEYGLEYFGVYYGLYRGTIADINDPKKLGRVQLKVPQIGGGKKIETWAWPAGNPAGDDFGDFMIPPKGAPVWVFFENGNLEHPVYMGGHWGKSGDAGRVPEEARSNVKNRIRKTENWIMEMDDENDVFRISRKDTNFSIEFSGNGNITINGQNLDLTGAGGVDISGGTTIDSRNFMGHTHSGVEPGGGTSGGVV